MNRDCDTISTRNLLLLFFLWVLVLTLVVEFIQRESIIQTFYWVGSHSIAFLLNYLLVALVCFLFLALFGSLRWGLVFSMLLLLLIALVNMAKKQFLGEPLLPWDLPRADQAINLLPNVAGELVVPLILLVFFGLIIFGGIRLLIPHFKLRTSSRITISIMVVLLMTGLIFYRHTPLDDALKKIDIEHVFWLQTENSLQNGYLLGFLMNIEAGIITAPKDYSESEIQRIFEEYRLSPTKTGPTELKPNVIIIMNEAFWDPTILPGLTFSEDPLPYFRWIKDDGLPLTLISPVFGGTTANVEFEILTGLSTSFLPTGTVPYQQYIDSPIPSLPDLFKAEGYITTAIHPYHDWFYKRKDVYPRLGFDNFINLDNFDQSAIKGEYIADIAVSKKVVDQIENSDQPQFIFAVTMQNHGPYPGDRYDSTGINITGEISPQGIRMLEVYAEGVKDADSSLKYLADYLYASNKPTIIVFTGDHLPYLGKEYMVYQETGFIEGGESRWNPEESLRMKSVPLVIWSNYDKEYLQRKDFASPVSASFLGNYILELTNLHRNANHLFRFSGQVSQQLPVLNKTVSIDNKGNIYQSLPEHLHKIQRDYHLLQYDVLFGKKYYIKYSIP